MKIIKPNLISGEIMDLITSAKKKVIIITPYHEITGWDKLINKIKKAQSRGIYFIWYSRKGIKQKYPNELRDLFNIKPILIDDLHAKIYFNETSAVITSMNLCKTSDEKSTDIGHLTQNQDEFKDILSFYENYIKISDSDSKIEQSINSENQSNREETHRIIRKISPVYSFNCIHEHIINQYGSFRHKYKEDQELIYKDFLKPDFELVFEFYENAIKVLIQIPQKEIKKFNYELSVHNLSKNVILSKELEFWESKGCIKYFYKSNFKIKDWAKRQLDFFIKDLDMLIELINK